MKNGLLALRGRCVALSAASLLIFAAVAGAKDPPAAARGAAVVEAPMRVSTEGLTYAEYLQRQDQLNQSLAGEMPLAAFEKPLRVSLTQAQINEVENAPSTPLRIGAVTELDPRVDVVGRQGLRCPQSGSHR